MLRLLFDVLQESLLKQYKQFYNVFSNEKVSPLATQLTWSHYSELLSIKDINKLTYYINISINDNLSKRELRERIKSNEYERLPKQAKIKLIDNSKFQIQDLVKNPIIIRNSHNYEIVSEKILQDLITSNKLMPVAD